MKVPGLSEIPRVCRAHWRSPKEQRRAAFARWARNAAIWAAMVAMFWFSGDVAGWAAAKAGWQGGFVGFIALLVRALALVGCVIALPALFGARMTWFRGSKDAERDERQALAVAERDIRNCALLMIQHHGDSAADEAFQAGQWHQGGGDHYGAAVWYRVKDVIRESVRPAVPVR